MAFVQGEWKGINLWSDDLTSEQSWRGIFWLPKQPDETREGFLTYVPDSGVTVKLVSGFDDRTRTSTSPTGYIVTPGPGRFSLIHGTVEGSLPVTLVDCQDIHKQLGWPGDGIQKHDLSAARLLTGVHLSGADKAVFSGVAVELENLTEWDRHDEATIFCDTSDDSPRGENWRVHINPMLPLVATWGDLTVELVRRYRQPKFDVLRDRLDIAASTFSYLRITAMSPKPMDAWFQITKAFQDLITLAMDAPCALLSESLIPSTTLLDNENVQDRMVDVFGKHILRGERDFAGIKTDVRCSRSAQKASTSTTSSPTGFVYMSTSGQPAT